MRKPSSNTIPNILLVRITYFVYLYTTSLSDTGTAARGGRGAAARREWRACAARRHSTASNLRRGRPKARAHGPGRSSNPVPR
eukprot:6196461-Pleurochrysis_carterae.AAC.3